MGRRGVLITGTDTGVGKTVVAAGLARALVEDGIDVGVMKPAETGWPAERGPWPTDAAFLREAAGVDDPADWVVPWVFDPPVAPVVAARQAGEMDLFERIEAQFARIAEHHAITLVEGAGGLSVPLDGQGRDRRDYADLAQRLQLPLLVVARAHLGTLNHSFLTVHYARARGLRVLGLILNGFDAALDDPSAASNPRLVEEMCEAPVWGVLPRLEADPTVGACADLVRRHLDLDAVRRALGLPDADRSPDRSPSEGSGSS